MSLIEKIEKIFPDIIERLDENGVEKTTYKLDDILEKGKKYTMYYTEIYSGSSYESFINEPFEFERESMHFRNRFTKRKSKKFLEDEYADIDKEETEDFYIKAIPDKKPFICEISEISEIFIAHIINYILCNIERHHWKFKLRLIMMHSVYRNESRETGTTFEDLIIDYFKESFMTLKIRTNDEKDKAFFEKLTNNYFFKFMCKYNLPLTLQSKEQNYFFREKGEKYKNYYEDIYKGINPELFYNEKLFTYFTKAMTSDDVLVKFLSFYHIIEYNFDKLFNDYIIKEIKGWLNDPEISMEDDDTILKFVDKVKKIKGKSIEEGQGNESEAFLLVLKKYIEPDKLKQKLSSLTKDKIKEKYKVLIEENNMLEYYKNNSVVFASDKLRINFNDNSSMLSSIEKRIYKTRNSLVHSKYNHNYKTYNHNKDEDSLRKEIPLIRAIAIDIIINTSENFS